jgi:DNA (cytosine-5)-methyltransferase 1
MIDKMRHASLFSGIGGFDLAASMMAWQNIFYCENNEFCKQVLKYHFPNSIAYADIKKTDFARHRRQIDILTGGFPCQPFSDAGLKGGTSDPRYLWPEMFRAVREIRPRWVVAENVRGLISWNAGVVFDTVCTDLENEGYKVWPLLLPACGVNAPHQRYRIWFVAYTDGNGTDISGFGKNGQATGKSEANREKWERLRDAFIGNVAEGITADSASDRPQAGNQVGASTIGWEVVGFDRFPTQSPICSGDNGLSSVMDGITFPKWRRQSIKGFGNAIVPQVAIQIFKTIEAFENETSNSNI